MTFIWNDGNKNMNEFLGTCGTFCYDQDGVWKARDEKYPFEEQS